MISKKAAKSDRAITTLSRDRFSSIGKFKMKFSEDGIGTNETILKPREVTTAINSNPIKSKLEIKN